MTSYPLMFTKMIIISIKCCRDVNQNSVHHCHLLLLLNHYLIRWLRRGKTFCVICFFPIMLLVLEPLFFIHQWNTCVRFAPCMGCMSTAVQMSETLKSAFFTTLLMVTVLVSAASPLTRLLTIPLVFASHQISCHLSQ